MMCANSVLPNRAPRQAGPGEESDRCDSARIVWWSKENVSPIDAEPLEEIQRELYGNHDLQGRRANQCERYVGMGFEKKLD